jgi:transposase
VDREHRARQAAFERRRYPTDLTDQEWQIVRPLLPPASARGRRPGVDLREVLNAIRYLARAGCGWRMLPVHFGAWQTIYWWFRRLVRRFLFATIHNIALMLDRERAGREASPTAGVLDSQTVKSPHAPSGSGFDAAKRLKGRKRHIAVDTDGRLLMVNLTAADVQDASGAEQIVKTVRKRWPWLKHLFADGALDRDGTCHSRAAIVRIQPFGQLLLIGRLCPRHRARRARSTASKALRKLSVQDCFHPLLSATNGPL